MKQINVRLDDFEYSLLNVMAYEWGISPTQYAKLQMLASAADWGMRREVMTEAELREESSANVDRDVAAIMQSEGFSQLRSGWWKRKSDSQWVKVVPRG